MLVHKHRVCAVHHKPHHVPQTLEASTTTGQHTEPCVHIPHPTCQQRRLPWRGALTACHAICKHALTTNTTSCVHHLGVVPAPSNMHRPHTYYNCSTPTAQPRTQPPTGLTKGNCIVHYSTCHTCSYRASSFQSCAVPALTSSMTMAEAPPPPLQMAASPLRPPAALSTLMSRVTMMAPLAPNG